MKFNYKGIRFKTWLYFFIFTFVTLVSIGLLFAAIIKPYYRDSQIEKIDHIKESLISTYITDDEIDPVKAEEISEYITNNNVCVLVLNSNYNTVYSHNSLGDSCLLANEIILGDDSIIIEDESKKIGEYLNNNPSLDQVFTSTDDNRESLLVAEKYSSNLSNYYILLSAPLELMSSYVNFILANYTYVSILIILIAVIVSYILALRITRPIVRMKEEASKLASGDYDVSFKQKNSYSEIDDLALTLDDATEKLSKVDELRKDLIANVSHDIKTPLTMIKAYAEMIKDISGEDPEKRNEHLDVIINEAEYLDKLVIDMLEYSKMQAGYIELNRTNVELAKICKKVIKSLKSVVDEKKIKVSHKLDDVVVYCDEIKITQVINNFITNAVKYTDNGGKIEIALKDLGEEVRFDVKDNGKGIKEEEIPYIWDRYYKIDKKFSRNSNSFGLGLAIAKAILEAHHAKYGVTSKIDEGSNFYFIIKKVENV